jgi:hypothetical protein
MPAIHREAGRISYQTEAGIVRVLLSISLAAWLVTANPAHTW